MGGASRRRVLWALPIWTLLIWTTRLRNVLGDDPALSDLLVPIALTGLGVLTLVDRRRWLRPLAAATVAVWVVRLPFVLVHDHSGAFKIVHTMLAVVSVGLALAAWRAWARRPVVSRPR